MSAQRTALACLLSFVALWALGPARADAAGPETAWSLQSIAGPTNFQPGAEDEQRYEVFLTNIGAKASGTSAARYGHRRRSIPNSARIRIDADKARSTLAISASCVPSSTIRPSSSTIRRSSAAMVESR